MDASKLCFGHFPKHSPIFGKNPSLLRAFPEAHADFWRKPLSASGISRSTRRFSAKTPLCFGHFPKHTGGSLIGMAASVVASALALSGCGRSSRETPNVLLILADDLGYGDLGCYGAVGVSTPCVDALSSEGVRFTNVHATASTSTPSRYSILTGEYPWRKAGTDVAAGNAGMIISPSQYTLADLFKARGYATAAIGKWHLGLGSQTGEQDWNSRLDEDPSDLGFDYHYIMAATADRVPCVFIENGSVASYDPSAPIEVSYAQNFPGEPTLRDDPSLAYNLASSHGHDQSVVNGIGRIGYMKGGGRALWKDENIADSIAVHACRFMEQHSREPFFMYLATNDIHVPRFPSERFRGASSMGLRGDAIAQFDWTVGRVLSALDSLGLSDNTLVILTSDNGPVLDDGYADRAEELVGSHSPTGHLRGGKYSAFEGGTAVPMIVRWPGRVAAGSSSERLISQVDFLRSLAVLLGFDLPEGAGRDSRDYRQREYVLEQASDHTLSLRDSRWKYIEPSSGPETVPWGTGIETGYRPEPQLYDLSADPHETLNVAASHPAIADSLFRIINNLR